MDFQQLVKKDIETVTVIKPINHRISDFDLLIASSNPKNALHHAASVLSDVQEMVLNDLDKRLIIEEINEAKYWIFKVMTYLHHNPECQLRDLCPFYKKIKNLRR